MGFWNDGLRSPSPSRRRSSHRSSTSRGISSFFFPSSSPRSYGSSSRARPRSGLMAKVRRFFRKVYEYMRAHPIRVFMLVIMPLITGGALSKILQRMGVRLPSVLERLVGGGGGRGRGDRFFARGGARDFAGGSALPGMMGGGGIGGTVQGLMKMASMFV